MFWRKRKLADFSSEIEAHLALEIERLQQEQGLSYDEAHAAAYRSFGNVTEAQERFYESGHWLWLDHLWQDVRFALRMLRKSPGFTMVAVLTLALGIGANTAIFSFVDAVLLRSLPVKHPQQLVVLLWSARVSPKLEGHSSYGDCAQAHSDCSFSIPFFDTIRAQDKVFSGMAAFAGPLDVDLSANGSASIARGTYVSSDFFSTLGINTFIGRPLASSDDTPSAAPAIVLSYAYWIRAFGSDRTIIGRTVRIDNTTATIVGVADPHFTNLTPGKLQDFYMPFSLADRVRGEWWGGNDNRVTNPKDWWVVILARLKPGIPLRQAQAAATTIFRNVMLHGSTPFFKAEDAPAIALLPAQAGLNGETHDWAMALYVSLAIVGFILLIACANVGGLTLARSNTRQKEMAVRLALGAGRARLIRQLLVESLLLSLSGGLLGVLLAFWRVGGIVGLISSDMGEPFPFFIGPDWRVLAFAVVVTFITALLFGLAPAMRGSRIDLTPSLKENASSVPGAVTHMRHWFGLSGVLVIAQVALSIMVLIGAGLLIRTLRNLQTVNPGFDARNILLFDIDPTIAGYTDQQTQQLYSNLQQRFAALPGVISASYSEDALLDGGWSGTEVHLDGAPPKQNINPKELSVGLDFFSTMRIPILAGRTFNSADFAAAATTDAAHQAIFEAAPTATSNPASSAALDRAWDQAPPIPAIINESFAKEFLSNENPVGMHMGFFQRTDNDVQHPGPGYTIVGIAGDTKYAHLDRETVPILFRPVFGNSAYFELRTATNPTAFVKSVREIVSQTADNLPITHVRTQVEQIEDLLSRQRLMSRLSTFYAAIALLLACIGLYGLLSYEVTRRTRELGIRVALGAQRRDLLRLVVGQGTLLVLIGTIFGVFGALGVTRFMSSMLYGIDADDPATFAAVAILLTLVALAACYIPARRAMRVDPMVALRHE